MSQGQISQRLRPFKPTPFGRYTLLLPLSTGGMGEIYLAQLSGSHGFDKLCVIKKILPHLAEDQDFVSRFVDEARILVKLHHGSIAQVLDMGVNEGMPYIALEFVDGKDLRRVLMRMRERNHSLPLSFVLSVMSRVLDALAYAHRKRADDDSELNLVHRDVSPQNVLISYEGEVKVIDFGLAKSAMSVAKTSPSIVLGKFMYMSPEQARHKGVDRRSDLYAVGLCLWELVVGRNPFDDVPSGELMAKVANPSILPLTQVDPLCPSTLSDAVMRALHPDPAQRFQTAEEFRGRLQAILMDIDPQAGAESTSRFMRDLFAPEYASERRVLSTVRDQARALQPDESGEFAEEEVSGGHNPTLEAQLTLPPEMDDETPAASHIHALQPEALSFAPTRKPSSPNLGKSSKNVHEKETMPAIVVTLGDDEPPLILPAPSAAPAVVLAAAPMPMPTAPMSAPPVADAPAPVPVRARVLARSFENESTEAATPAMAEPDNLPSIMIDGLPSEPVNTELEVPAALGGPALVPAAKAKPLSKKPEKRKQGTRPVSSAPAPRIAEKKSARLPPVQRTDTMIVRNPLPAEKPVAPAPVAKKGGANWAWFVIPTIAALAVGGYIAYDVYAEEIKAKLGQGEVVAEPAEKPAPPPEKKVAPPPPLPVEKAVEAPPPEAEKPVETAKKTEAPAVAPKRSASPGAAALSALKTDFARIVDEGTQRKYRLKLDSLEKDVEANGDDQAYVAKVQSLHQQVKTVLQQQEPQ